ncbi:hypothetical protein KY290_007511 [Solanum tuberosum]|uniref:Uncharacterized protein n=1 Tax=Solanum tuberosum TaxID=4113 RepID=A0ABQ7W7Y3_SOLTU|nr:hypothetical protein KY290_007511 [Solanum tuberosum]
MEFGSRVYLIFKDGNVEVVHDSVVGGQFGIHHTYRQVVAFFTGKVSKMMRLFIKHIFKLHAMHEHINDGMLPPSILPSKPLLKNICMDNPLPRIYLMFKVAGLLKFQCFILSRSQHKMVDHAN